MLPVFEREYSPTYIALLESYVDFTPSVGVGVVVSIVRVGVTDAFLVLLLCFPHVLFSILSRP